MKMFSPTPRAIFIAIACLALISSVSSDGSEFDGSRATFTPMTDLLTKSNTDVLCEFNGRKKLVGDLTIAFAETGSLPGREKSFLYRRWLNRLLEARRETFAETPFVTTTYNDFQSNGDEFPRPLLLFIMDGKISETLDLVGLPWSVKLGAFMSAKISSHHRKRQAAYAGLCPRGVEEGLDQEDQTENLYLGLQWFDNIEDQKNILELLNRIEVFSSPTLLLVGIFMDEDNRPHSRAFASAYHKWISQNAMKWEHSKVKFVGIRDRQISAAVFNNLTEFTEPVGSASESDEEEDEAEEAHEPMIVAIKPMDKLNMWMHNADTQSVPAIIGHIESSLSISTSDTSQILHYDQRSSSQIWSMDINVYIMVILESSGADENVAEDQLSAIEGISRLIPASWATFVIVPRKMENSGIIRYFGFADSIKTVASTSQEFVKVDIAILDRSKEITQKYRMRDSVENMNDTTGTNSTQDEPNFLNVGLTKQFLSAFFQGRKLEPFWKSAEGPSSEDSSEMAELQDQLSKGLVERVAGRTLNAMIKSKAHHLLIGLTAKRWCAACERNLENYRSAAAELLTTFPKRLRVITVDIDENEIAHLIPEVGLRQQPWQYTMPVVFRAIEGSSSSTQTYPWKTAHQPSISPIDAAHLIPFVKEALPKEEEEEWPKDKDVSL